MSNWIIVIPMLSLFATTALALVVIPTTRGEPGRPTLHALLLLIALWTFSSVLAHSIPFPSTTFWLYLILLTGLLIGAVGVHFSVQFAHHSGWKTRWVVRIFYIVPLYVSWFLFRGQLLERATLLPDGSLDIQWAPMSPVLWVSILCAILLAIAFLFSAFLRSSQPDKKHTIFPLLGYIVMCLGALSNVFVSSYPIDMAAGFIFVGMISYGVVGSHILVPSIKLPWYLTLSLIVFLLMLCHVAIMAVSQGWLGYTLVSANIIAGLTTLAFGIVVFAPARKFLLNILERVLFPDKYRYQQALSKLGSLESSIINWHSSIIDALNIIAEAVRASGAVLLVRNEKARHFEVAHAVMSGIVNMSQTKLPIDSPLVTYLGEKGAALTGEEIERYSDTGIIVRGKDDTLRELEPTLYYAIQGYDGILAIVALTHKSPRVLSQTENKDFLKLACGQIAPLIINANLYQESQLEIEERKRMAEALIESEEKYRTLVENTPDCIYMIGKDKKFLSVNKSAANLFRKELGELVGKTIQDIFPREIATEYITNLNQMFITGMTRISESKFVVGGKELWLQNFLNPIKDAEGEVIAVIGVSRDITEIRRLQEEQQKMTKLESVGTLAGGIAHDFNNLLTGIMGNISMAKRHVEPGGKAHRRLDEAEKASERARDLTQQLLTFSRGGAPIKKAIFIGGLIKDTVDFALRGSKVRPEFSIPDDLWTIEADEGQINQVITNITINADEAMPEGGILNVAAKNTTFKRASALPLPMGNYVEIAIEDQGVGISKEHIAKIFDPYFTTKQKGSGLGLATTYSIIRNHGGHITVESVATVGTTFRIYLPASKKATPKKEEERIQPSLLGKGRVLVMDDEETIRELLSADLTEAGYTVELTKDGAEAIERYKKAEESGEPFDVVIMDLTIPGGMGGREAIKQLLEIDPDAKAIVSSGYSTDPVMADYKKYGFSAVVTKPYSVGELEKKLRSILKGKK